MTNQIPTNLKIAKEIVTAVVTVKRVRIIRMMIPTMTIIDSFKANITPIEWFQYDGNIGLARIHNDIVFPWPFRAWCPLEGHAYLNKPAAESCRFV